MQSFYQKRKDSYSSQISLNNTFPPHLHKQIELIYVLEGNLNVSIDGNDYILDTGDISLCFPNLVHSTNSSNNSKVQILIFDVEYANDFTSEFTKYKPASPVIKACDINSEVLHCLDKLHELHGASADLRICNGYYNIVIGYLLPFVSLNDKKSVDNFNTCQQILMYIDNHFTENLTLDSLSASLNVSKYYISHIFTSQVKSSFPTYLNSQRVKYARHLLKTTSLSVTDISYDCGFSSPRTFYRVFNEIYGISPLVYRNSSKV